MCKKGVLKSPEVNILFFLLVLEQEEFFVLLVICFVVVVSFAANVTPHYTLLDCHRRVRGRTPRSKLRTWRRSARPTLTLGEQANSFNRCAPPISTSVNLRLPEKRMNSSLLAISSKDAAHSTTRTTTLRIKLHLIPTRRHLAFIALTLRRRPLNQRVTQSTRRTPNGISFDAGSVLPF